MHIHHYTLPLSSLVCTHSLFLLLTMTLYSVKHTYCTPITHLLPTSSTSFCPTHFYPPEHLLILPHIKSTPFAYTAPLTWRWRLHRKGTFCIRGLLAPSNHCGDMWPSYHSVCSLTFLYHAFISLPHTTPYDVDPKSKESQWYSLISGTCTQCLHIHFKALISSCKLWQIFVSDSFSLD